MTNLELTDDEAAALARLLTKAIVDDKFPLSSRVQTWLGVLSKLARLKKTRPVYEVAGR